MGSGNLAAWFNFEMAGKFRSEILKISPLRTSRMVWIKMCGNLQRGGSIFGGRKVVKPGRAFCCNRLGGICTEKKPNANARSGKWEPEITQWLNSPVDDNFESTVTSGGSQGKNLFSTIAETTDVDLDDMTDEEVVLEPLEIDEIIIPEIEWSDSKTTEKKQEAAVTPAPPPVLQEMAKSTFSWRTLLLGVVIAYGVQLVWKKLKGPQKTESNFQPRQDSQSYTSPSGVGVPTVQDAETVEWVNMCWRKAWRVYQRGLERWVVGLLQPVFDGVVEAGTVPTFVQRLHIMELTFDHSAPYFSNMRRRTSRKDSDLSAVVDVRYTGGARMLLMLEIGGGRWRLKVPVLVSDLDLECKLWVKVRLAPLCPYFGTISLAFVGPPNIKVQLSPYNRVRLMRVPVVQNFLKKFLTEDLPGFMVLPRRLNVNIPPAVTAVAEAAVGREAVMRAVASAVLQADALEQSLLTALPLGPQVAAGGISLPKSFQGELSVTLQEGRNLPVWGFPWQSNPYCRLTLGKQAVLSKRESDTGSQGKHKCPIWNQEFEFLVEDKEAQMFEVYIKDSHMTGRPDVGKVEFTLKRLPSGTVSVWLPVQPVNAGQQASGELHLELTYKAFLDDEQDSGFREAEKYERELLRSNDITDVQSAAAASSKAAAAASAAFSAVAMTKAAAARAAHRAQQAAKAAKKMASLGSYDDEDEDAEIDEDFDPDTYDETELTPKKVSPEEDDSYYDDYDDYDEEEEDEEEEEEDSVYERDSMASSGSMDGAFERDVHKPSDSELDDLLAEVRADLGGDLGEVQDELASQVLVVDNVESRPYDRQKSPAATSGKRRVDDGREAARHYGDFDEDEMSLYDIPTVSSSFSEMVQSEEEGQADAPEAPVPSSDSENGFVFSAQEGEAGPSPSTSTSISFGEDRASGGAVGNNVVNAGGAASSSASEIDQEAGAKGDGSLSKDDGDPHAINKAGLTGVSHFSGHNGSGRAMPLLLPEVSSVNLDRGDQAGDGPNAEGPPPRVGEKRKQDAEPSAGKGHWYSNLWPWLKKRRGFVDSRFGAAKEEVASHSKPPESGESSSPLRKTSDTEGEKEGGKVPWWAAAAAVVGIRRVEGKGEGRERPRKKQRLSKAARRRREKRRAQRNAGVVLPQDIPYEAIAKEVVRLKEEKSRGEDGSEQPQIDGTEQKDERWIMLLCFLTTLSAGLLTVVAYRLDHF